MRAKYLLSVVMVVVIGLGLGGCAWLFPQRVVAILSATPTSGEAPLAVTFDPSASTGGITSFTLAFGDGSPAATGADVSTTVVHTYDDPGTYTAQLTVQDARGRTDTDTKTVVVSEPPGPTATLGVDPSETEVGEDVTFYIEGSPPAGKKIVKWTLDYGDGTVEENPVNLTTLDTTRTHQYGDADTYTAVLTVEDEDAATATDSVTITVNSAPPEITSFTANGDDDDPDPVEVTQDTDVVFAFDADSAPDRKLVKWELDSGDGYVVSTTLASPTDTLNVSHTYTGGYEQTGSYTATVMVWDDADATDSKSLEIEVVEP